MIEKLFAWLGYVPEAMLNIAYNEGLVDGQQDVQKQCESIVEATKAKYEGIERERDHFRNLLADNVALSHPPRIVVTDFDARRPGEHDPDTIR